MANEVAEEAKYQNDMANCNIILELAPKIACVYLANYNYDQAMMTILNGYFMAFAYWDTCEQNCPCN